MNQIMNFTYPKEALEWATIIAKSKFCPKEFFNHPESVLVAIAYGNELGLKPLQALQNICVINGKPSIYGDAMLAVCKNSPDFEYIKEGFIEPEVAQCEVKRKNQPPAIYIFGKPDAITAGLWGRPGPWKQYPLRMLQMRARGFALRDCFPDVLKGMIAAEEAQDYKVEKSVENLSQELSVVLEQQEVKELERKEIFNKLIGLMHERQIKESQIVMWCKKANVEQVHQLPVDIMQKLITHLEQMETPNGQS